MPGCAAVNCSNSSTKGFLMKKFPRNPYYRMEWAKRVKRDKWTPTDHSVLCEVHFAPETWEKTRVDGKRKLRWNAVPTIFAHTKTGTGRKKPLKAYPVRIGNETDNSDHSYSIRLPDSPISNCSDFVDVQMDVTEASTSQLSADYLNRPIFDTLSVEQRLDMYSKIVARNKDSLKKYRNKLRSTRLKLDRKSQEENLLRNLFERDQVIALRKKIDRISTKFMKWSDKTMMKAFKLKFSCGNSGYEELLRQNLPYPSTRTLQRRLQCLNFDSGVLTDMFNFMKVKVGCFNESEKDCVLMFSETAITPGKVFDSATNRCFGDVTLPGYSGTATHVLVFSLAGINSKWKQIVAYYFKGNSVTGSVIKDVISSICEKCNEINLNTVAVVSDGPCADLWKTLGIAAGRHEVIRNGVTNPRISTRKVYFLRDVPNLFKKLKATLVSEKVVCLSKDLQEKYDLPTGVVSIDHVADLVEHQKVLKFRLFPKPTEMDLTPPQSDKKRLVKSPKIVNHDVTSALKFVSESLNIPEYLTTAWFIDKLETWYQTATCKSRVNAANKTSLKETIGVLHDFMEIIDSVEIGEGRSWKSVQSDILVTTKSILDVQKYLLEEQQCSSVTLGSFSHACLDGLNAKDIMPDAIQMRNNLKHVCITEYMKCL